MSKKSRRSRRTGAWFPTDVGNGGGGNAQSIAAFAREHLASEADFRPIEMPAILAESEEAHWLRLGIGDRPYAIQSWEVGTVGGHIASRIIFPVSKMDANGYVEYRTDLLCSPNPEDNNWRSLVRAQLHKVAQEMVFGED